MASKGEMIAKTRNEFIWQAVEVEDREAAGKRVVNTCWKRGDLLDLTSDREARSVEGSRWPHPGRGRATCDAMRGAF